jgi:hypothetical protein
MTGKLTLPEEEITITDPTKVGLVINSVAGQTADQVEFKDSGGNVVGGVSYRNHIFAGNDDSSGSGNPKAVLTAGSIFAEDANGLVAFNNHSNNTASAMSSNGTDPVLQLINSNALPSGMILRCRNATSDQLIVTNKFIFAKGISSNASGAAANVFIDSTTGAIYKSTSSIAIKRDVVQLQDALPMVNALNPVYFKSKMKDDGDTRFLGFIAEEVADAVPEASADNNQNYDVRSLVAVLIKAVQELTTRLEALEAK